MNRDLLVAWLGWKANESKLIAQARTKQAKPHRLNAIQLRHYAGNVCDNFGEEKSRVPRTVNRLREKWVAIIETAENEENVALSLSDQAEDAVVTAEFYGNKMMDIDFVQRLAAEACASECSFEDIIDSYVSIIIKRVDKRRRVRRFGNALWKWTRQLWRNAIAPIAAGRRDPRGS